MNFPNDETGQVLAVMHQAGIDLTLQHDVVFFQLFEQQSQAQAMVDYLAEKMPSLKVNVHADEIPNVWDVDCTLQMIPTHQAVIDKETEFEKIAAQFSGYNDGWGIEA